MIQIPDSLRDQLAPVVKYHFWLLVPLVPLALVPAVFMADATLKATIEQERSTIDGQAAALAGIRGEQDHPNDAWVKAIDAQGALIRTGLVQEWQALWDSQQELRAWPGELGREFLTAIDAVEKGTRLELELRDRQTYQDKVRALVMKLPQRMGCEQLMAGEAREPRQGFQPRGADEAEAMRQFRPLEWRAADQKRIFESFVWKDAPSTWQVRLAQEELWVYGLFCDTIARMNTGAKGAFDAAITTVDELAVGYQAAEDRPGGAGTERIKGLKDAVAAPPVDDGLSPYPPAGEAASPALQPRPYHPRFSPGGPRSEPTGAGGEGQAALTTEDELKQWIYVDFAGRPLTAPELATSPDALMVHLMPFRLRVTIDQRQVDRLLADLAGNPIPIDVRQVRINADRSKPGGARPDDERRPSFEVTLELRGTVGLATPPDPGKLGAGEQPAGGEPGI